MILKLINEVQLSRQDRKKFIPFINERNHMGQIIVFKQKSKLLSKSTEIFQNLKKTTKQYLFDKKYQKMKQKLQRYKISLKQKTPNYDQQIKKCFNSLHKKSITQCQQQQNRNDKENKLSQNDKENKLSYIELNQKLSENISTLKRQIEQNKLLKMEKSLTQFMKHKSLHCNMQCTINKVQCKSQNSSQILQNNKFANQKLVKFNRIKRVAQNDKLSKSAYFHKRNYKSGKKYFSSLNKQIFKDIGSQSNRMVDFTNFGLKYKHLVDNINKDPWKKWYIDTQLQVFPGQVLRIRKLQKSIYDQ